MHLDANINDKLLLLDTKFVLRHVLGHLRDVLPKVQSIYFFPDKLAIRVTNIFHLIE